MTRSASCISVVFVALVASGCPKDDKGGGTSHEDGGSSNPGSGGRSSGGGGHDNGGGPITLKDGGPTTRDAGSSGGGTLHDGGSIGGGALDGGKAGACKVGGCSSELCSDQDVASPCIYRDEFACYKTATCERQADGRCDWTATAALQECLANPSGTGGGALKWYQTCGTPVCMASDTPYDDPNIPNCTKDQTEGAACDTKDQHCDGVAGCGATLVCNDTDPKMGRGGCPISRARYKQDIEYLDARQLRAYHAQLMDMPLASYRYKSAPDAPQLGFIIDDVEPSVAVAGDQVNMYGYLSMAVAAIKVQAQQIDALEHEVEQLRTQVATEQPAMCTQ